MLILSVAIGGLAFGAERRRAGAHRPGAARIDGTRRAQAIQTLIEPHRGGRTRGPGAATLFGVAAVLFGASGAFGELQHALNQIWEVEPKEQSGWTHVVRTRLASFALVVVIGFLLLVSLVVGAALAALDDLLADVGALQPVLTIGQALVSYAGGGAVRTDLPRAARPPCPLA